ncbi:MAG: DNA-processing protein DprA [Oscillospiraceae bacterium]
MNSAEYWIWLQNTLGVKTRIDDILAYFKSPKNLIEAGEMEWRLSGVLSANQIDQLSSSSLDDSFEIIEQCRDNNIQIITPDSEAFPVLLKTLSDMPAVLYTWGDLSPVNETVCISVVGTRNATISSVEVAKNLSKSLVSAGATVVSGGALGIDTAAHTGALEAQGKTVAVLGCGLLTPYLMENKPLRNQIEKSGAVISEYPPTQNATRSTFPIRNRIISGMSVGTVVIEAGEKSGSLITASLALSQGRDVFAVPGDIVSSAYTGANKLIRDGARPVFCAMDVLEEYSYLYPDTLDLSEAQKPLTPASGAYKPQSQKAQMHAQKAELVNGQEQKYTAIKRDITVSVSQVAKQIYEQFSSEPLHINDIAQRTGLGASEILGALTELEIFGYITLMQGRKYIIK